MKYDLEGICQDCMYLEKVKPLFEEKDKEIDRLKGALQTHEILLKTNVEEIDRLNNIINELEKTIENRLMAVPDNVLDDGIEEIKRTTKIAVYQVILGDLDKLKALKENNNGF